MITSHELGENYCNVPSIIAPYYEALEEAEDNLQLGGKTLKKANTEHATWMVYYDQKRAELSVYVKLMETQIEKVRGQAYKRFTEHYNRDLSESAKNKYIDHDSQYIETVKISLIFQEAYDKYAAVVDAFKARGFALRNLVEIAVNELDDRVI